MLVVTAPVIPVPVLQAIEVDPSVMTGGQNTRGTVRLTAAPAVGFVVTVFSSNAAATVPAMLTVPAGEASQSFTIATRAVASDVRITLSAVAGGQTRTVLMRLTPPPP